MTAITPLEFIHKKGIFGDHQKKKRKRFTKNFRSNKFNNNSACATQNVQN